MKRLARVALAVRSLGLGFVCVALVACERSHERSPRAEFGVLFGGDIQDRETLALELDRAKQELGLRVTFAEPVRKPTRVSWEIERPGSLRGLDGELASAAELGAVTLEPGERRADASFAFRRDDPPGTWRVRISVEGKVVLDRELEVVARGSGGRSQR